jgi:hypothetical protein
MRRPEWAHGTPFLARRGGFHTMKRANGRYTAHPPHGTVPLLAEFRRRESNADANKYVPPVGATFLQVLLRMERGLLSL